jgi:hypothetical protein
MKEILRRQSSAAISRQASSDSLLDVSAGNSRRALVDVSEMIKNQLGTHNKLEMVEVQESPYVQKVAKMRGGWK